jgi:hypothetical protein
MTEHELDEPSPEVPPEMPSDAAATASERASAQATGQLSEPTRLDGSQGDGRRPTP